MDKIRRFLWRSMLSAAWSAVLILLVVFVAPSMPNTFAVVSVILVIILFAWGLWQGIVEIRKAVEAAKQFPKYRSPPPDAP